MAAKLLSLYLLAVAGLQVVQAAPLILDQRSPDNSKGISQGAGIAVTRAEPSILDQRSVARIVDPVGRAPQGQSPHDVRQSTSIEESGQGSTGAVAQSPLDVGQGGKKKNKAVP